MALKGSARSARYRTLGARMEIRPETLDAIYKSGLPKPAMSWDLITLNETSSIAKEKFINK
jgi:hypothetical protein